MSDEQTWERVPVKVHGFNTPIGRGIHFYAYVEMQRPSSDRNFPKLRALGIARERVLHEIPEDHEPMLGIAWSSVQNDTTIVVILGETYSVHAR